MKPVTGVVTRIEVAEASPVPVPCSHALTMPGERPRWRYCLDCETTVHQQDTEHYRKLRVL